LQNTLCTTQSWSRWRTRGFPNALRQFLHRRRPPVRHQLVAVLCPGCTPYPSASKGQIECGKSWAAWKFSQGIPQIASSKTDRTASMADRSKSQSRRLNRWAEKLREWKNSWVRISK
jgi:hypothetical protein